MNEMTIKCVQVIQMSCGAVKPGKWPLLIRINTLSVLRKSSDLTTHYLTCCRPETLTREAKAGEPNK